MATCRAVETRDGDSGVGGGGSASQRPTHILIVIKQRFYQEMEKLLTIAANLCQTQPKQSHYLLNTTLWYSKGGNSAQKYSDLVGGPSRGQKKGKHVRKCVVSGEDTFESCLFFLKGSF